MVNCSLCGELVSIEDVCSTLACRACHKSISFEDCLAGTAIAALQNVGSVALSPKGRAALDLPPLDGKQFICDLCRCLFKKGRSDEEAMAEARDKFGALLEQDPHPAVVCDTCYKKIMAWAEPPGSN